MRLFRLAIVVLTMGMIALPAAAELLTNPVWLKGPTDQELQAVLPNVTEDDFQGSVTLNCRILDGAGHLRCRIVSVEPSDDHMLARLYGSAVKKAVEDFCLLDVERTVGAKVGRRIKVVWHFEITD